jgi:hypothetical protein
MWFFLCCLWGVSKQHHFSKYFFSCFPCDTLWVAWEEDGISFYTNLILVNCVTLPYTYSKNTNMNNILLIMFLGHVHAMCCWTYANDVLPSLSNDITSISWFCTYIIQNSRHNFKYTQFQCVWIILNVNFEVYVCYLLLVASHPFLYWHSCTPFKWVTC